MIFAFKTPRQDRRRRSEGTDGALSGHSTLRRPIPDRRRDTADAEPISPSIREDAPRAYVPSAGTFAGRIRGRLRRAEGAASADVGETVGQQLRMAFSDRSGGNRHLWFVCLAVYIGLAAGANTVENPLGGHNAALLIFLLGACMISVLVPATGPRGQRFFLLPGMALASMLLLPPLTANLPVLIANAVYAACRETSAARRISLLRGCWIFLAALLSGIAARMHAAPGRAPTLADAIVGSVFFCIVYMVGRRTDLIGAASARKSRAASQLSTDFSGTAAEIGSRSHGWYQLECLALLASTPFAVLMLLTYSHAGIAGLAMTTALFALIVLIAHYGFEVAMLREQVKAMEKISAVTWSQTSPKRVVDRFVQLSSKLIPWDRTILWLTDNSQTRLEVAARLPLEPDGIHGSLPQKNIRFGEGLVGRVADHQHAMIVRDGSSDPRYGSLDGHRNGVPFSVLLLPLVVAGETVGVAQFERDTPQSYSQRDVSRVQPLASQAAATIANVRMHMDVYNQAVTDALTGLFNRRHMQSVLADERRRAERYGHVLSLIMLDVDGFKNYNDTYGHPQGDVLLKQLAEILRENVRNVDIVGRYGGEEFIIVMPETSKDEAFYTAERLRNAVADSVFPGHAGDVDSIVRKSISLGVASFPIDTDDAHTLVSKADQALYRAKHAGRNRTVLAGASTPAATVIAAEGPVAR